MLRHQESKTDSHFAERQKTLLRSLSFEGQRTASLKDLIVLRLLEIIRNSSLKDKRHFFAL